MRPQSTRALRREVMALSPTRERELAWAVAGDPTLERGGGGMAGSTAAAALRLPFAQSVTANVPRGSPPPPSECRLTGEQRRLEAQRLGATASARRLTPAPREEQAQDPTPRGGPVAPCRLRPGLVLVVWCSTCSFVCFILVFFVATFELGLGTRN